MMTKLSDTQRVILSRAAQHDALLAEPPAKLPTAARQSVLRSLITKGLLEEVPAPREHTALGWRQDEDGACIALRITASGLAAIGVEADSETGATTDGEQEDQRPRDERHGVDPGLVIGDLVEDVEPQAAPAVQETAISPTAAQGDSLAAFPPAPPFASVGAPDGPQRPPVSPRGGIGGAAALRTAATALLATWDAPDRTGLDAAVATLRDALSTAARRLHRDPATPRQPRTGTKQEAVLALLRRDEGTTIAEIIDATGWQPHTVRGFLTGLKRRGVTVEVLERVRQVGPNNQGAKGSYSIYRIAPTEAG
jgi:hypothetical protein